MSSEFKASEKAYSIKYTYALKKIWDEHALIRENMGLPNLSLAKVPKRLNSDLNTQSSSFLVKTNFINDEKLSMINNEMVNIFFKASNYQFEFRNELAKDKITNFQTEYTQQKDLLYESVRRKFNFYINRTKDEKRFIVENRFEESQDLADLSSDKEMLLDSDLFMFKEQTLKTAAPQTIRLARDGELRLANSSNRIYEFLHNICEEFADEKIDKSKTQLAYQVIKQSPKNIELIEALELEYQYPFIESFEDIKEFLPNSIFAYGSSFYSDSMNREVSDFYSNYFLSRFSRVILEDDERTSLSIRNDLKLPDYIFPQMFEFREKPFRVMRHTNNSKRIAVYMVGSRSPILDIDQPASETPSSFASIAKKDQKIIRYFH